MSDTEPTQLESDQVEDREWLARIANRDLAAFEALFDRYSKIAFSLAARITGTVDGAEDVVQEAFLGVWRNASRYDEAKAPVRSWLLAIVHHCAVDAVRGHPRANPLPDAEALLPVALHARDVWPEVSAHLDAEAVRAALKSLSPVQREAIELAFFQGLTHQQIATQTGAPLGTVKSRIREGVAKLRDELRDPVGRNDRYVVPEDAP